MFHTTDHPSYLGSIRQGEGLIESFESKALDGLPLVFGPSNHTFSPLDCNRMLNLFHHETFLVLCGFLTPFFIDLLRSPQLADGLKGSFDEVVRVVRSKGFC